MPETVFIIPEDRLEDPREREDWFVRLPDDVKDELREQWRFQEGTADEQKERRHTTTWQYVMEGVVLFGGLEQFFGTFVSVLTASAVGALAGWIAALIRARTYRQVAVFVPFYVLLLFLVPFPNFFGVMVVAGVAGLLGAVHELQRWDRTEL